MYDQDWLQHMKLMMEHAQPGDTYDMFQVYFFADHRTIKGHGSTYVKTEIGYRSALYINRELITEAPYRI